MNPVAEDILMHYGIARRSGRYPWGSGEDPYQRNRDFLSRVEELKRQGWTETPENIKSAFGMTTGEYRMEKTIANDQRKLLDIARAKSLQADGDKGATEIGRIMGVSESTVRGWLQADADARIRETAQTIDFLRDQVNEKGMVDVGVDVDRELGISKTKLDTALYYLETKEGYPVYSGGIPQVNNPGQQTTQRVLCVPGTEHKDIYNYDQVHTLNEYASKDGGETFKKFVYPESLSSKRLQVCYAEDGGIDKDGIVELRRGVKDLSLGESHYSQVRILVDGTHYIKGMAVYADDLPPGVDVRFNTNKTKGTPALGDKDNTVLKVAKEGDNPFGSLIGPKGQSTYIDKDGNEKLSLINKRADQGDWSEWKDTLPSQFLSKQSKTMIDKQLGIAKADKLAEYESICELNNPTIKKHLLAKFADECDAAAVHLKAAALPNQKYHVIIPINTLKDNEIYAPQYDDGTKLALVRYPHGGTFEIPILKVNNKHDPAKKIIGDLSMDAVGINKSNADRLSGADFDGDTVMCIPTHDKRGLVKVSSQKPLKELEGFDPKVEYGPETYKGRTIKFMTRTDKEMGVISNLITDMTLMGAENDELARAVKHSMVVIDAEKHKLDYKRSEVVNDIASLKKKYQARYDADGNLIGYGGASTIISKAKGQDRVDKRQGTPKINIKGTPDYDPTRPEGALIYKKADDLYYVDSTYDKKAGTTTVRMANGKKITYKTNDPADKEKYEPIQRVDDKTGDVTYTNRDGSIVYRTKKREDTITRMENTDDAHTLVSPMKHPKEIAYADYANSMKALANQARIEMVNTGNLKYNASAKEAYRTEYDSLMSKLNDAKLNTVRERAAQRQAAAAVKSAKAADENISKSDLKKVGQQALNNYRAEYGTKSRKQRNIEITDREWEAIQAGAITESKLQSILNNTDIDALRQRATPSRTKTVTTAQANKIKALSASYTIGQIADKLNLSTSTVSKYLK